jgi:cation transport ATPase
MTAQTIIRPGGATLDIAVRGMTCASCVGRVERALRGVDGVEGATVNLATDGCRVSLAPWHSGGSGGGGDPRHRLRAR